MDAHSAVRAVMSESSSSGMSPTVLSRLRMDQDEAYSKGLLSWPVYRVRWDSIVRLIDVPMATERELAAMPRDYASSDARAFMAAKARAIMTDPEVIQAWNGRPFGLQPGTLPFASNVTASPVSSSELMVLQKFQQAYGTDTSLERWKRQQARKEARRQQCGYGMNPKKPHLYACTRGKGLSDFGANDGTFFGGDGSGPVPGLGDAADVALALAILIPGVPPFP